MILRELFYYDKETLEPVEDNRYDPQYDQSVVELDDTQNKTYSRPDKSCKKSKRITYRRKSKRNRFYKTNVWYCSASTGWRSMIIGQNR